MTRLEAEPEGNHGMTKGVDESVLEWIGDEELPPPEENPQTAGTFMPSMYSNPYLEKLEKARANGEPDPSPEPSAEAAKEEAEADKYLTPKDATTCVSNNVRSIDSWCRDMCGAGVCTAEMCVCDGEAGADADADAGADADADADATEAAPAAGHERLATPSAAATAAPTADADSDGDDGPDKRQAMTRNAVKPEAPDEGTHGMTKGVDESVLEWIGDE